MRVKSVLLFRLTALSEVMIMTDEEYLKEITIRSQKIIRNKNRHSVRMFSVLSSVLLILLISVIVQNPSTGGYAAHSTEMGAFLLGPETGGYVLVAVLAFVAGISLTILCLTFKKKKNFEKRTNTLKNNNVKETE